MLRILRCGFRQWKRSCLWVQWIYVTLVHFIVQCQSHKAGSWVLDSRGVLDIHWALALCAGKFGVSEGKPDTVMALKKQHNQFPVNRLQWEVDGVALCELPWGWGLWRLCYKPGLWATFRRVCQIWTEGGGGRTLLTGTTVNVGKRKSQGSM